MTENNGDTYQIELDVESGDHSINFALSNELFLDTMALGCWLDLDTLSQGKTNKLSGIGWHGKPHEFNIPFSLEENTKLRFIYSKKNDNFSIEVIDGGNDGDYSIGSPPIITLNEGPLGPESILPEFSPNVSAAGTITSVDVLNSGRNFLPTQNLSAVVSSGSATFRVNTDPILFTVSEATDSSDVTGISTVTFNEFIPYAVFNNTPVKFVRLSRIITSSHSFEYIGAGTDINTSNPFQGGKPIPENEVIAINGGQIPFTSTDQKGNFRIGDGLTIDQTTSTIRGRDFNRAIQAQLTPLILALR